MIWFLLSSGDDRSEEQRQKERDEAYSKWLAYYKSLDDKGKKWEMRKNAILVYGFFAILITTTLTLIFFSIYTLWNTSKN